MTYKEAALSTVCSQPPIIVWKFDIFDDCLIREGEFILFCCFIVILGNRRWAVGGLVFFLLRWRRFYRSILWSRGWRTLFFFVSLDKLNIVAGEQTTLPLYVASSPPILDELAQTAVLYRDVKRDIYLVDHVDLSNNLSLDQVYFVRLGCFVVK
jgi:hypothetical protein